MYPVHTTPMSPRFRGDDVSWQLSRVWVILGTSDPWRNRHDRLRSCLDAIIGHARVLRTGVFIAPSQRCQTHAIPAFARMANLGYGDHAFSDWGSWRYSGS